MTHSRNTAWRLPKVTALRNHQLDATIAAYIGYLFKSGNSLDYGKRPVGRRYRTEGSSRGSNCATGEEAVANILAESSVYGK